MMSRIFSSRCAGYLVTTTLLCTWMGGVAAAGQATPLPSTPAPGATAETIPSDNKLTPPTGAHDFTARQLDQVLAGSWRSTANRARDAYRHPKATLQFFGIQPDQTVIEVTPGGGWYTEILAPLLNETGQYVAAMPAPASAAEARKDAGGLKATFAEDPAHFGKAKIVTYNPKAPAFGAPGSADAVLTFRNVHNWAQAGTAHVMFKAFYAVLKPGGVLGVVDHRANDSASLAAVMDSGYLPPSYVKKLATDAGFKLQESSDINANSNDNHDHPQGVWTLPPSYALGAKDHAKYQAIGESDRMTLRFVKPLK